MTALRVSARGLSFPYAGTRTDSAWTRGVSSWTRSDAFRSTRSTCSVSALLVSPTQPLTIAGTAFRGRRRAFSLWKVLIYNLPYLPQLPGVSVCSCWRLECCLLTARLNNPFVLMRLWAWFPWIYWRNRTHLIIIQSRA